MNRVESLAAFPGLPQRLVLKLTDTVVPMLLGAKAAAHDRDFEQLKIACRLLRLSVLKLRDFGHALDRGGIRRLIPPDGRATLAKTAQGIITDTLSLRDVIKAIEQTEAGEQCKKTGGKSCEFHE